MHPCPVLRGSRVMLWSTALSSRFAYVTALVPAAAGARAAILRTRAGAQPLTRADRRLGIPT